MQDVVLWISGIVGAVTSISLAVNSIVSSRRGEKSKASELTVTGRRDTVTDRDALIKTLQEERNRAVDRADAAERMLDLEIDYNRLLQDHIYRGNPPPPPGRKS